MKPVKAWAVLTPRALQSWCFERRITETLHSTFAACPTRNEANRLAEQLAQMVAGVKIVRVLITELPATRKKVTQR